jgi:3-dehydroquinate synthase
MLKLTVNTSKIYDITIGRGLKGFKSVALNVVRGNKIAIIFDSNVYEKYSNVLDEYLDEFSIFKCVVLSGEENKNFENYYKLINYLAENKFNRNDAIITFGGGVVGDLGAFVASTYMRGISLISVPTTLLSMVDSSVGGKNAINLESGKNLVGTFYQPSLVYIATNFLHSLPNREILSGMGEVIKYAFMLMYDSQHTACKCICCNGNQGSPCTSNRASRGTKTWKG